MSVLIKGIDMPKDGGILCITIYPDGIVCLNRDLECKRIATAVPVQPHGRLIDADALCEGRVSNDNVVICAKCAPTIIPAEPPNEET